MSITNAAASLHAGLDYVAWTISLLDDNATLSDLITVIEIDQHGFAEICAKYDPSIVPEDYRS